MDVAIMNHELDIQKLSIKARKAAMLKVLQSSYESMLRSDQFDEFTAEQAMVEKYQEHKMILQNLGDPILKEFKCVWITISPEDIHGFDANPTQFNDLISIWLKKCKHVSQYVYAIEQRSDTTDNFYGVHAHILIYTDATVQAYTRWIEWVKRKWSPYVGTTFQWFMKNKKGSIYFKDLEFATLKLPYLNGDKTGEHKQALCKIDVEFRKKHNIQPIYASESLQ